jgi:transposase InsO family protein
MAGGASLAASRLAPTHHIRFTSTTERRCNDRLNLVNTCPLAFGQKARDAGIAVSMGSNGCAYDNAVAESFFATLKKELVHPFSWPTRRELSSEVFEYLEAFYNRVRRHSTLGMLSPADYENGTLSSSDAGLAASRLAHSPTTINI